MSESLGAIVARDQVLHSAMADNKRQIDTLNTKHSPFTVAQCKALLASSRTILGQYIQADTAPEYWLYEDERHGYIEFEGSHFQADESTARYIYEDVQKMLLELDHRKEFIANVLEIDLDEIRGNLKARMKLYEMSEIEANFTLKRTGFCALLHYHLIEGMSDKEALPIDRHGNFMERIGAQDQGRTVTDKSLTNEEIRARYFQRDFPDAGLRFVVRTWPD
ncbi:hypothetical protein SPFM20_00117 [Salmonella phage SPFM20]|nr:hypothetical protein SPFM20_00117 [Salmonella phage SPFM20]